ncbi:uncharacterized protein [Coffea arabica]|uniref:FLZ-type domain-containing protein n=1 Tax=Coffea arabica TaxID=13443 RepID=A0A6P6SIL7_COFAR|nr:FCS-Like Zinc finger 13-like [Coffea arabica]
MANNVKNTKTKKLSINLSLFTFSSSETPTTKLPVKSPRNFEEPNGVVGLGILAALKDEYCSQDPFFKRAAILAISPRSLSNPISILSNKKFTSLSSAKSSSDKSTTINTGGVTKRRLSIEEMELCEEYTCVISHVGDNQIKKKEYFDDGGFLRNRNSTDAIISNAENISNASIGHWVSSEVVSASSAVSHAGEVPVAAFPYAEFLNSCFLCKKQLHGLDIFMYRGEKAFCSAECRYQQISIDEHKEKCVSGTVKPLEYSASPCSGPMQFFAGVAAA